MFTYIELFAGIGGFRQALDKLGGECVFASEIDKYAAQAYGVLYGECPAGDITKIEAEDIPDHDLLVGGFPCQSFSVAGKRAGFEDIRGTLFFDVARIAMQKQPKVILLENVKGLINHDKGNTFRVMIEMLCNIGYTVDFDILNSKYFGVPQNRERVFIVGVRSDLISHEPWNIVGNTVVPRSKQRLQELEGIKTFNFPYPQQSEVTTRLRDILESDVDEKYYLSDDKTVKLVAQLEAKENRSLLQGKNGTFGKVNEYSGNGAGPTLTATCYKEPDMILETEPQMIGHDDIKGHDAIKRVYSTESVGPTLTTMGGGHREPKIAEPQVKSLGNVNPSGNGMNGAVYDIDAGLAPTITTNKGEGTKVVDYSRKDGIGRELTEAHTLNSSDWCGLNRNQKQNAVLEEVRPVLTPDRMEKRQNGRRFKDSDEEAFTLTSQDKHGVAIGEYPRYRIRKLTPLECWRLQGFSDEAHDAVESAGVSDSQRYKQAGNAVTVNVIEAVIENLIMFWRR